MKDCPILSAMSVERQQTVWDWLDNPIDETYVRFSSVFAIT